MSGVRLFAHRGSSASYPEHTRAAYQQAIFDGADGIECDVRLSADGQVVCWHDETLDRTTGIAGRLDESTVADLRRLDLLRGQPLADGLGGPADQLMTLPALLELMSAAGRPMLLAIELKVVPGTGPRLVRAVLAALDAADWDAATGLLGGISISIMCDDLPAVDLLLQRVPPALVMLLSDFDDPAQAVSLAVLDSGSVQAGPDVRWVRRDPERVRGWLAAGSTVRVWTVDAEEDLDFCVGLGIREITTNRPAELRLALEAAERAATFAHTLTDSMTAAAAVVSLATGILEVITAEREADLDAVASPPVATA